MALEFMAEYVVAPKCRINCRVNRKPADLRRNPQGTIFRVSRAIFEVPRPAMPGVRPLQSGVR